MRPRVVVVGGGIAGLTVAYEIAERAARLPGGIDLRCFEAGERAGGHVGSAREQGFLYEWGATGFLDDVPETVTLVRRLGLGERVVRAEAAAARRYVLRRGRLREIPLGPAAFLTSRVLSPLGKLRLLLEPCIPRRRATATETVYDFAARRIGREAASVLVDAMVSGVFAGDARRLELESAFPAMRRMEDEHGGLFRALLARRRRARESGAAVGGPSGPAGRLTSLREGLQELVDGLVAALGERLVLDTTIRRVSDLGQRGYRVHPAEGAPFDVDAVVIACPAPQAARILRDADPELARALEEVPAAPVTVAHLGYRRDALGSQPDGFGFLVPRGQGARILGVLLPSNIFEGRAPAGSLLLTVMLGGAHDPEAAALDDAHLLRIVRDDLRATLSIHAEPYFVRVVRHPRGIPQYTLGHRERLSTIERRLDGLAGLRLTGSSLRGVSINACVSDAVRVAAELLEFVERRGSRRAG